MSRKKSLAECYVDAWMLLFPEGPKPEVVTKKWRHGRCTIITTGSETVHLLGDEFVKRLLAVEQAAEVIDRQRPRRIAAH